MEDHEGFTLMAWNDVRVRTDDDLWIVPGMVSNTSTLLYGESESGKSFLASSLIASLTTGCPFLGTKIVGGPYRVAVGFTDDQGGSEYKERIMTAITDPSVEPDVLFTRVPVMCSFSMWLSLLGELRRTDRDVLIIDNMSQAADGDLNTNPAVRDFFGGVRLIVESGIPVIVVGHSTQKTSKDGGKSDLPMGHSAIVQSVRWRVFVKRYADDTIKLTFSGNAARKHDITVHHGDGANFDVKDSNTADERLEKERQRESDTLDEYRDIAVWIERNCQGKGVNQTVAELVEKFGRSERTYKQQLSKGKLAAMLNRHGTAHNTVWTLRENVQV